MSLIRYLWPIRKTGTPTGFAAITFDPTAVDDIPSTVTVRGPSGGVATATGTTDRVSISVNASSPAGVILSTSPMSGSDDISKIVVGVNAAIRFFNTSPIGSTITTTVKIRRAAIDYTIGAFTVTYDGSAGMTWAFGDDANTYTYTSYTLTAPTDPATSVAWDITNFNLTNPWVFGQTTAPETTTTQLVFTVTSSVSALLTAPVYYLSHLYLEVHTTVGPTDGPHLSRENWRWCDVCGRKTTYSRIVRPMPPHPQAGKVICGGCLDQPDHDTNKVMSKSFPRDKFDPLY